MPDPSKILLGKPGAIEQPLKATGGPLKPTSVVRTWRGPKAAVMALLSQIFPYFDYNYEENGPNATLQIDQPYFDVQGGEVPINNWELLPGAVEKDLLEADLPIMNTTAFGAGGITDNERAIIRDTVANPNNVDVDTLPLSSEGLSILKLMLVGVKAVKQFAPVLTHTQTVSGTYATVASATNVRKILSNATLIATEAIPASFLIALNGPPYNAVSTRFVPPISYGWFKNPATLNSAYGGRQQITQQWEFGLWPHLLYGAPI